MGIHKLQKRASFRWNPFDFSKIVSSGIALPDERNPVIVRYVTRSELAAIPKDRYAVKVIKVSFSRSETGELVGEEALMVAITDIENAQKQLKQVRFSYRTLLRKFGGGGGGGKSSINPFCAPIDQHKMADCIIQVMDDFFHGEKECTIYDNKYSRMEFCVLMHIFFKKANFLKKDARLPFSQFLEKKVFAGKSGFVRSYNTYADKDTYKDFEDQLNIQEIDFRNHPVPIPKDKKPSDFHQRMMLDLKNAFQEIGWAFQKSPYFTELKALRETMNHFELQ